MASERPSVDLASLAAWVISLAGLMALLIIGADFLVPLTIAILLWSLLEALRDFLQRWMPDGWPGWLSTLGAFLAVLTLNCLIYLVLASQGESLVAAAPAYQERFLELLDQSTSLLGALHLPDVATLLGRLDVGSTLSIIGSSTTGVLFNIVLIFVYVGFLLAERSAIASKLDHLPGESARTEELKSVATAIAYSVRRYIWMKTVVSGLTALLSYIVLTLVGVDFAPIWALLVFFLNFIPNIGSMLGVVFPALMTLIQFDGLTPFVLVTAGLGLTQFVIGNVVEPAYMGRSLNLSSFMIILSLTFWGMIWGIPGMFLSVPLMVVTAIVCSQFENLRWIAVMLSVNGKVIEVRPDPAEPR